MRRSVVLFVLCIFTLCSSSFLPGQSRSGELHLHLADPAGLGLKSLVELVSDANQYHDALTTDDSGDLTLRRVPFGVYQIHVKAPGFAPFSRRIEILSALPVDMTVTFAVAAVTASVIVKAGDTLIDPHQPGAVSQIGSEVIANRPASLPGRSLQDLVNSQPGWVYEGNAVLHPRGSEYQTQFVVDGVPFTDNRSPGFAPEIEADDVQAISTYTAGIPAEYGRKLGGVVEINTARDTRPGLHGQVVLSGGSFDTAAAYGSAQWTRGRNSLAVSGDGARTDHYLNPVVPQNFTNTGTTGAFSAAWQRDLTSGDNLRLTFRHGLARFLVPGELLQETAGQRQHRDNFETAGIASWQKTVSANVLAELRGMFRDDSTGLTSNAQSIPIAAFQQRGFREGYFKASVSIHRSRQEWKAGVDSDVNFLREQFSDVITDRTQFDPGTPASFSFRQSRPDLEQSAFIQDLVRAGPWTVSAGLRWDHYQLLVNRNAVSPRLSVARYFPSSELALHASYDRAFQTPAFENILLSSSSQAQSLNPSILRLPVPPSRGNYYEIGGAKAMFRQLRIGANVFDRRVNNYPDDDQLLNTAVSFPIAFATANLYGAEGRIEVPGWARVSGFVSYSYIVGSTSFPATGGLLAGVDAVSSAKITGRFWDSQDQRHSVRTRFRWQVLPRLWAAAGGEYGSGLPVAFAGSEQDALATYGPQVAQRVNFAHGRVRPTLSLNASAGAEIWKTDSLRMRMQVDVDNMNDRLNVIDFAGLFSGNAIAPPRSYSMRLETIF